MAVFILVGCASTTIDFAIYNLLTSRRVGFRRIPANLVSTSVAMLFSFAVNLSVVFPPEYPGLLHHAMRFLAVTMCALYGLQTLIIFLLSRVWLWPARTVLKCSRVVVPQWDVGEDFVGKNVAKLCATLASLVWNFCWYKWFVFT